MAGITLYESRTATPQLDKHDCVAQGKAAIALQSRCRFGYHAIEVSERRPGFIHAG
jgi:hypothetical protein